MHVRVIPYLVQYMQHNFKNILIYIYINRFISVRLSAELMYSVIYIYIYLWIVMTHVLHKKKMIIHKLD